MHVLLSWDTGSNSSVQLPPVVYLSPGEMDEDELTYSRNELMDQTNEIKRVFSGLLLHLKQDMESTAKLEDVVLLLSHTCGSKDNGFKESLRACKSLSEVFNHLSDFVSFFNFDLVKLLTHHFGSPAMKKKLKKYKKRFQNYSMRRVYVYERPKDASGEANKIYIIRTDKVLETFTVGDLDELKHEIRKILRLRVMTVQQHKQAYEKMIAEKLAVNIRSVRFNNIGLPRSGKTSFWLRLMKKILNISNSTREQPSTGLAKQCGQVLIRKAILSTGIISSTIWKLLGNLEEANMLSQFFFHIAENTIPTILAPNITTVNSASADSVVIPTEDHTSSPRSPSEQKSDFKDQSDSESDAEDLFSIINEALETNENDIKYILKDSTLLISTDTGGHAEFLELQASLVSGPSFNLLFSRLQDDLDSPFDIYFTNEEGESSERELSDLTVEEVMFQALSSIACFSNNFSVESTDAQDTDVHKSLKCCKSKVLFVGTHKDEVSEEQIKKKDELLRQKIDTSEQLREIVEFASEDQMMLTVDNMNGDYDEIDEIQKILMNIIERSFKKIAIPTSWLMLSLLIRTRKVRLMELKECEELAGKLNISPDELQHALWFLHYGVGVLLYYPDVPQLKDTVICEMQALFDSVTHLIKKTYTFKKVGRHLCEKFRKEGEFSLKHMEEATQLSNALIPMEKLVKLLEHLNILTALVDEQTYFMPCVLKSQRASDLGLHTLQEWDPPSLMLRYDCGYMPVGIFPSVITNIVSQGEWEIIKTDLYKNKVQFRVGEDRDIIFLICRPQYFEIAISQIKACETTSSLCNHVREIIESTLHTVTSRMHYDFSMEYKFGFECPSHPGKEHICVMPRKNSNVMECIRDKERFVLKPQHKLWFQLKVSKSAASMPEGQCYHFTLHQ